VGDRRVAIDRVSARPKEKVARLQILEFERIVFAADDRLKSSGAPEPDILRARIPRNVSDPILFKHIVDETGTIHSADIWIVRAVLVSKIASREIERASKNFFHVLGIIFKTLDLFRQ